MAITLDSATERHIQHQIDRGAYAEPAELIAHALDLLEAEEDWLLRNRDAINTNLNVSFAQAARGEGYSLDKVRTILVRLGESCAQADRGEGYTEEELRTRMAERRAKHPLSA
jgi:Arc/MetJ-type ribon-helix-helix transcriptional regulator